MEYKGLDFSADLVKCYNYVREGMAQLHPVTDFGPEKIVGIEKESMNDEEHKRRIDKLKNLKKEGYNRIKHKIKELRSEYKAAIDKGTRSGSGRLVHENFDILQRICGGSPAVTSLTNRICSQTQNERWRIRA